MPVQAHSNNCVLKPTDNLALGHLLAAFLLPAMAPVARKPRKAYGTRKLRLRARKASRKF